MCANKNNKFFCSLLIWVLFAGVSISNNVATASAMMDINPMSSWSASIGDELETGSHGTSYDTWSFGDLIWGVIDYFNKTPADYKYEQFSQNAERRDPFSEPMNQSFSTLLSQFKKNVWCDNENTSIFLDFDGTLVHTTVSSSGRVFSIEINGSKNFLEELYLIGYKKNLYRERVMPRVFALSFRPSNLPLVPSPTNAELTYDQLQLHELSEFFEKLDIKSDQEEMQLMKGIAAQLRPTVIGNKTDFYKGIVFTAGASKGDFIEKYIEVFPRTKCIYFVDDNKKAVIDVLKKLKTAYATGKIIVGEAYHLVTVKE
ncbi:MAG: DUF2608 domain-containing protein [Oligoflexia bacterium]|nr:DUF2608 domain-containing protein [Oligoflexia bacterium]